MKCEREKDGPPGKLSLKELLSASILEDLLELESLQVQSSTSCRNYFIRTFSLETVSLEPLHQNNVNYCKIIAKKKFAPFSIIPLVWTRIKRIRTFRGKRQTLHPRLSCQTGSPRLNKSFTQTVLVKDNVVWNAISK